MYEEAETEVAARVLDEPVSADSRTDAGGADAPLDSLELEAVALNLEASLRIFNDHHFFGWTQGLLQNLVRHEVLVCARRKGENGLAPIDCYATAAGLPESLGQQFARETGFVERLVRDWQANRYRPLCRDLEADGDAPAGTSALRGLAAAGITRLVAHGAYDDDGRMVSFFAFACRPADAGQRQAYLAELVVPFLHAAWLRTKVRLCADGGEAGAAAPSRDLLTQREREVLKWVCLGKSNIEIGMILGISSLTVKNHVQEILRRLNVQNRAQAVGKAFDLHILHS